MLRQVAAPALLLLLAAPGSLAQERASDTLLTVNHYLDWEQVADPRISPDGSQILYTRRWVNRQEDRWESAVWIMNADGSRNRFLVRGTDARWSPDGSRILYLADGEPRGTQIFVRWLDQQAATSQVTRLSTPPSSARWSPDGRWIAFATLSPDTSAWRISMPRAPQGANWTPAPRVVERLHYRQDRRGFMEPGYMHLFVVPADGGTPRQLTSGAWHVGSRAVGIETGVGYSWAPDGRTIVVDGLREEDADYRLRESHLYAVDVASGAVRQLTSRRGYWTGPEFSPDGRSIAYTGYEATTQTYRAAELWLMNADGSGARQISGNLDRSPSGIAWAPDGSGLYFTAEDHGAVNAHFAPARGGPVRPVTQGAQILTLTSLAQNFIAVGLRSDPDEPPDVVRYDVRSPQTLTRLTAVNDDVLHGKRLGAVEEFWAASPGGPRIQGWIVKPPGFDPTRRYPMVMEIHGGPHAMYGVGFNYSFQNFAANDYVVVYTNPRGSTGYGTAFGAAISQAYPGVDYDDLMAAVDTVLSRGYVDRERLYVGGCSGGGVLSSWVTSHTNRFAAAAVRCPVTNWISMAGTTDIAAWTYAWFSRPFWEDPAPWLARSSLMHVANVSTPTLLMTGELDLRTPMPQTEEYYVALKMRRVPVTMLRFNGEYHGTSSRPSNFMRTQLYMMSWYQRWRLGQQQAATGQ